MRLVDDSNNFKQPDSLYIGQFTKPFILNFNQRSRCIGVSLQPWVGNLLFDIPAQEFKDRITQVESIGPPLSLLEKLLESKNESGCFHELELFLAEKFRRNNPDKVSHYIAKSILNNSSNFELKNILSNIGFTRRRIEQRFLESTGITMGFFIRKLRFQKAVCLMQNQIDLNLTHIGLDAGYYDQNHFIKEFKDFSGITPKEFRKQHSKMKDFVSELMMVNFGKSLINPIN